MSFHCHRKYAFTLQSDVIEHNSTHNKGYTQIERDLLRLLQS